MCLGPRRGLWARDEDLRVTGGTSGGRGKGMDEEKLGGLCSIREGQ